MSNMFYTPSTKKQAIELLLESQANWTKASLRKLAYKQLIAILYKVRAKQGYSSSIVYNNR